MNNVINFPTTKVFDYYLKTKSGARFKTTILSKDSIDLDLQLEELNKSYITQGVIPEILVFVGVYRGNNLNKLVKEDFDYAKNYLTRQ